MNVTSPMVDTAQGERSAVAAASSTPQPRRKRVFRLSARLPFAIPGFVVYAGLVLVPLILSIYFSLTNRSLLFPGQSFVGFQNYARLLTDSQFLETFDFTLVLTISTLVVVNAAALGVALLLNWVGRLFFAMRLAFFIPVALSGAIIAFLWSTILTDNGLLNTALRHLGLGNWAVSWLGTPLTAQFSVILVSCWQALSLGVVVYLAGLQTVPADLVDAAKIDGCGRFAAFRHVTWPLLAPSLTINSTLLLINGFKAFDIPTVLTATGPGYSTSTVATEVIRVGFSLNRVGLASAMAVIMVIVVAVVTIGVTYVLQKREVSQ